MNSGDGEDARALEILGGDAAEPRQVVDDLGFRFDEGLEDAVEALVDHRHVRQLQRVPGSQAHLAVHGEQRRRRRHGLSERERRGE